MATVLSFLSGRQITDANGNPVSGAKLNHYLAGTTDLVTTYQNQAGTTPHENPVVCDAGGFVPLIYISDVSDWKVVITTSANVVLKTYDNLPAAPVDESSLGFAPPLHAWEQVNSAASPKTLTASDAGKAYEVDTTSGNVEFDLPSAASVGNGKGFVFKKIVAANSMIIDPNALQTIDDVSTSLTVTSKDYVLGIYSNGAEWYRVDGVVANEMLLSSFINGLTLAAAVAENDELLFQLASAGAFRKIRAKSLPGVLIAIIEDQKTQNTGAGTFTSGADQIRTLNTLVYNRDSLVTLSSNQFTLPAGSWEIEWTAPAFATDKHQSMLYDVTGAAVLKRGSSQDANTGDTNEQEVNNSTGVFVVTPSASNAYEIRHRCQTTGAFGIVANLGTEVYTRVVIRKVL